MTKPVKRDSLKTNSKSERQAVEIHLSHAKAMTLRAILRVSEMS